MKKLFHIIFFSLLLLGLSVGQAWAATNDWVAAGASNWSTAASWSLGHKPAAGEDVTMGGTSDQNCVVDEPTAALNSLDQTGYSGVMSGAFNISIIPNSGTVVAKFANGASHTWSGALFLSATGTSVINLTWGGMTTPTAITLNGGNQTGTIYFLDAVTIGATRTLTLTAGTLHTDGASDNSGLTHSWGLFTDNGSTSARVLTLGNSTINITGTNFTLTGNVGLTVNKGTSTINMTYASGSNFQGGGASFYTVTFNASSGAGSGNQLSWSGTSFVNLTVTATGVKTDKFRLGTGANIIVTGIFTVAGNSSTNRLLFFGNILGTPNTITLSSAAISTNNVDFRDITFARSDSGALDLTAGGTHSVGDCGGNSKTLGDSSTLTFTTAYDQTVTGNSVNWDVAPWTGTVNHVPPLPQDNVVISLTAGQTLNTNGVPRLGKNISFGTATNLTLSTSAVTSYGSLDFTNAGTFGGNYSWDFESQARSGTITLTSNGKSFSATSNVRSNNTTFQFADAYINSSSLIFFTGYGSTINTNGNSITARSIRHSPSNTTITFNITNSTLTATGTDATAGTSVFIFSSLASLTATNSNLVINDTSSALKTFAGTGLAFYNLSTPSGTGGVAVTGANSFNQITVAAGGKLTLPSTVTNNVSKFVALGSSGNVITLNASTGGSAAILNNTGGYPVQGEWLDITDVNVTPANKWYYGNHSTWHSGTGWNNGYAFNPLMLGE